METDKVTALRSESASTSIVWRACDMDAEVPELVSFPFGELYFFSRTSPLKHRGDNEDAAMLMVDEQSAILAIADGVGSSPNGARASRLTVESIVRKRDSADSPSAVITEGALQAHKELLSEAQGNCTTLVAFALNGEKVQTLHAGDSLAFILKPNGSVVHRTVAHSPVALAERSGLIAPEEAISHPYRNIVSRVVGQDGELFLEAGTWIDVQARDILLIGSDGLFDNMFEKEIIQAAVKPPLKDAVSLIANEVTRRMNSPGGAQPSHPDDLTFMLLRFGT